MEKLGAVECLLIDSVNHLAAARDFGRKLIPAIGYLQREAAAFAEMPDAGKSAEDSDDSEENRIWSRLESDNRRLLEEYSEDGDTAQGPGGNELELLMQPVGDEESNEEYDEDEEESDEESLDEKSFAPKDLLADEDTDTETTHHLSAFEKHQQRLSQTIATLENENISAKPWVLSGEVGAKDRPVNSLLEEHVEFDHATKSVPVVTTETTESLEELIKKRIIDGAFDDVERKREPLLPKKRMALDEEKSKVSLGEIYEKEYLHKQQQATTDSTKDKKPLAPETKKAHEEIIKTFESLCHKLDSLSNHRFMPKSYSIAS